MGFILHHTCGKARTGQYSTDHGTFQTPVFMPVATQGTVKAVTNRDLTEIGFEIILSNTYHLYLRPGTDIMFSLGGLHTFIAWDGPILTDSGGYQVYSLSDLRKIHDGGVEFTSHLDGSRHLFTPERVIEIQRIIGSDIMMVLDECPPYSCGLEYAVRSNDLTMRWARRCLDRYRSSAAMYDHGQSLFAIVQGSVYPDVRRTSASRLVEMEFDGYALGGLAVGEPIEEMYDIIEMTSDLLPADKPRYLMGVGTPQNLLEAIERGIDMVDCVLPTRNGRNAMLFTRGGPLTITNARFKDDGAPPEEGCACYTCRNFSRAYLRHLFQAKEILGLQLATIHNLFFYQRLMADARIAIRDQRYDEWKKTLLYSLRQEAVSVS